MIDKVGAIVIHDRKMLVVREKGMDAFFIPGGKRDGSETDEQTLKREIMEETGASVLSFNFYKEFISAAQASTEKLRVRSYFCTLDKEPKPSGEIEEILWVSKDSKANLGHALKVIIPDLAKHGYM